MDRCKFFTAALAATVYFVLPLCLASAESGVQPRQTQDIGFGWKFLKGDPANAQQVAFDDSNWREVNVPHDWSIEEPKNKENPGGTHNGYFPGGIGWYRKHFRLSSEDKDRKVFVEFGGVYEDSDVWINGHSLGKRPYGYTSFQHDLTPHVKFGEDNVLVVRVDNTKQPNCRWYTGSGIYRNVHLTVTDKLHAKHWGTYVTTPRIAGDQATVRVRTEVQNNYGDARECELVSRILDSNGNVVGQGGATHEIPAGGEYLFEQEIKIESPQLWSIDNPQMYTVQTVVKNSQELCDEYKTPFGIREIKLDKDQGFLLNGQQVKLQGVCIHHDGGSLGAAVPVRAWERRLGILKSIGCNAIRMSHNPPAPELLDLCDRMGFVVIHEAFDKWSGRYGRWFPKWGKQDLTDMIRRDRNHPSVIVWSVGNELYSQGSPEFMGQLKELVELTHQADPTRPVTVALMPKRTSSREENAKKMTSIARLVDAISCNYQEQSFEDYRKEYPEIIIIASESYPFYRSKDTTFTEFVPLNPWLEAVEHDYVVGTFYWTGIDYLGEAVAGWPFHGWNCSLIDTCGWVRPFANLHKSFWTEEPMVHIAVMDDSLDVPEPTKKNWDWPKMVSHWTLPQLEGKEVKIATFTNCSTVELEVNGESKGTKKLADFPDKMITWVVPYAAGEIEARGIVDGKVLANHTLRTAGAPAQIQASIDRPTIRADGRDLCYIDLKITDKQGVIAPSAEHEIRFEIDGPGVIVGVDNGDLTSMEPYKSDRRKAFHGRAQVIIQSTRKPGSIVLKAKAEGLPETRVAIDAK